MSFDSSAPPIHPWPGYARNNASIRDAKREAFSRCRFLYPLRLRKICSASVRAGARPPTRPHSRLGEHSDEGGSRMTNGTEAHTLPHVRVGLDD
jgi:hypothetical protein